VSDSVYEAARERLLQAMGAEALASLNGESLRVALTAAAPGRMPGQLREYWTRGEGAAKIRWGTDGSFDRCVRMLRKYFPNDPKGLCARLHKAATGEWPAEEGIQSSAGWVAPSEGESAFHLPGRHNQKTHGNRAGKPNVPGTTGHGKAADLARVGTADLRLDDEVEIIAGPVSGSRRDLLVGKRGSVSDLSNWPDVWVELDDTGESVSLNGPRRLRVTRVRDDKELEAERRKKLTAHAGPHADLAELESAERALAYLDEPDEYAESLIPRYTRWEGMLAPINKPTGDRRIFEEGSLGNRDLPLPLLWQEKTDDGHARSSVVGTIETLEHRPEGTFGTGRFLDPEVFPDAQKAIALLKAKVNGPSVDLDDVTYSMKNADGTPFDMGAYEQQALAGEDPPKPLLSVSSGRISAATLVSIPAFAEVAHTWSLSEAYDEEGFSADLAADMDDCPDCFEKAALAAAAGFSAPPLAAFMPRQFAGPTAPTIEGDLVYGHLAAWSTCHVGFPGTCVTPPHSPSNYAYFHTGETVTAEGERLAVGRLVLGAKHADLAKGYRASAQHYDETGRVVALVRAYEDDHGIAFAGVLVRDLDEEARAEFAAMPLSGDWRRVGGSLELIGAISVPVPGFPVARATGAQAAALVAAGVIHSPAPQPVDEPDRIVITVEGGGHLGILDALRAALGDQQAAEVSGPVASEDFAARVQVELAAVADTMDRERMALLDGLTLGE
jgi:hypothetical protein